MVSSDPRAQKIQLCLHMFDLGQVLRSAEDQGSAESLARAQVPTNHDALLANSLIVLRFQGT